MHTLETTEYVHTHTLWKHELSIFHCNFSRTTFNDDTKGNTSHVLVFKEVIVVLF